MQNSVLGGMRIDVDWWFLLNAMMLERISKCYLKFVFDRLN